MNRTLVIVPTYNEKENITEYIEKLFALKMPGLELLIIDDSSPDGTGQIVKGLQQKFPEIHLLVRPGKLGTGTAYKRGFRYAVENGYDIAMQMDADFSHDHKDVPRLIKALAEKQADVVIGSRFCRGGRTVGWPLKRLLISKIGWLYAGTLLGLLNIKDPTGGFKTWSVDLLRKFDFNKILSKNYIFQLEMNFRAKKLGAKIVEIPITFKERERGVSKISGGILKEGVRVVPKLFWLSLIGKL